MTSNSLKSVVPVQIPLKVFFFIILAFIFTGCATYTRNEQPTHPEFIQLSNENRIGQSFLARFDGLQGISLYLKPAQDSSGDLNLDLYARKGDVEPLDTAAIQISDMAGAGYYNFAFSPIPKSTAQDYYFEISYDGSGNIKVGSAPGNTYLSGAQYIDGIAQNSQSSFRSDYHPAQVFTGLAAEGLLWLGLLTIAILMFALPGWAALGWLFPPWIKLNWISKICLSIGTGLAFYPVLFLWMDTLGIHSNLLNALFLPLFGLIFIVIQQFRENKGQRFSITDIFRKSDSLDDKNLQSDKWNLWSHILPDLALLLILAIIVFTRFWPIRILDAPMWGDSYQHSMMAQLIADNGGLFNSWEPYAQLESFTYHFGFHSLVANFNWVSGMDIIQSTLWMGQTLNIIAIMALYPLAVLIGKNKWAGVIAVTIAGLISTMPMSYVNWGRYTQLAGQIILPVIIVIVWKNLDSKQNSNKWNILVWLGLAGLALTHYRVTIFIPLFYIAYILIQFRSQNALNLIRKIAIHAVGVALLLVPWALRLFEGTLPRIIGTQINTAASQVSQATQESNAIGNIASYLPLLLWLLVILAIGWGIWTRNQKSNIFSLWWILIFLAANPHWLGLPGTGILTNFAVFIAAYIPASILIGSSSANVLMRLGITTSEDLSFKSGQEAHPIARRYFAWSSLIFIILISIGVVFVRPRIRDVRQAEHVLLTRPDLHAAQWIDENLPREAKFLVNSFFAYGGSAVVGSDGGWWLPLLTQRLTTQPPLTYVSEAGPGSDFVTYTNELIASIQSLGIDHPDILEELSNRGITHIYIGQQQGTVNGNPLIDAKVLRDHPNFQKIYHDDRVLIFEISYISP